MPQASIRVAQPGVLGAPAEAPWDRILVSADAEALPQTLVDQLTPDGVMVIPVRGRMTRVVLEAGAARTSQHGRYLFVPAAVTAGALRLVLVVRRRRVPNRPNRGERDSAPSWFVEAPAGIP